MGVRDKIVKRSIDSLVPDIFKRPLLHVNPSDPMLVIATMLALGPRIYVDGLVVLDVHNAVGIIGGRQTIEYMLYHRMNWTQGTANQIMIHPAPMAGAKEPLDIALKVFERSGFGFIPITVDGTVVTTLSVRDLLGLVIRARLKTPIGKLASEAIAVTKNTSIGSALELMLEHGIRTLVVREKHNLVLNDRMFLEFLLSHVGKQALARKGIRGIFEIPVSSFEKVPVHTAGPHTPLDVAARHLLDINKPCILLGNDSILTPWDVIMKGLRDGK